MLRVRLASLALACGFMFTLSGCCAFCEDGKLFPRLFRSNHGGGLGLLHGHRGADCECAPGGHMPPILGSAGQSGAIFTSVPSGSSSAIPITNIPVTQTPNAFKAPNAIPTPYVPSN